MFADAEVRDLPSLVRLALTDDLVRFAFSEGFGLRVEGFQVLVASPQLRPYAVERSRHARSLNFALTMEDHGLLFVREAWGGEQVRSRSAISRG